MLSDREKAQQTCESTSHKWQEEYYGYRCENCGQFIPYGCEPWMDPDEDDDELCPHCGGDGWGIVGVDWDEEDGVNGPFDGETERCPWCNGSGKAKDVTIW